MLTASLTITIPGDPATKGSLRCIGRVGGRAHVLIEDHKSSGPWRKTVAGWLTRRYPEGQRAEAGQPLGADVSFTVERPKAHHVAGNRARALKSAFVDALPVGHNTGDVDKLLRLVLDALQDAKVIPDDAAIVETTARKQYVGSLVLPDGLPWPGVRIRLFPLGGAS